MGGKWRTAHSRCVGKKVRAAKGKEKSEMIYENHIIEPELPFLSCVFIRYLFFCGLPSNPTQPLGVKCMRLNHPAQEGVMPCTVQGWPASACFVNIPPRGHNVLKTQVKTKSQKDAQVRRLSLIRSGLVRRHLTLRTPTASPMGLRKPEWEQCLSSCPARTTRLTTTTVVTPWQ